MSLFPLPKTRDYASNIDLYKERFLLKEGREYIPTKIEDIAYFFRSKFVFIKLFDKKSFIINYSLNDLESELNPKLFFRINRKIIVNISAIKRIIKGADNRFYVELSPDHVEKISISQEKFSKLKVFLT